MKARIDEGLLTDATVGELLCLYAGVLAELRLREVTRTNNAPLGDYAEWLVARAFGVQRLEINSTASYDLVCDEFGRVQVKARIVSPKPSAGQVQTSPFRSDKFDHAALVLLNQADYKVHSAVLLPVESVKERWRRQKHVNGWILQMNGPTMNHPAAVDIAERLRHAAQGHG